MIPASLAAFIAVGASSGLLFGAYLEGARDDGPVFVDGPSVTILLHKAQYAPGEPVTFDIVNSGTTVVDLGGGWRVTDLSGVGIYGRGEGSGRLGPGERAESSWGQLNDSGEQVTGGIYRITVDEPRASVTVTISR